MSVFHEWANENRLSNEISIFTSFAAVPQNHARAKRGNQQETVKHRTLGWLLITIQKLLPWLFFCFSSVKWCYLTRRMFVIAFHFGSTRKQRLMLTNESISTTTATTRPWQSAKQRQSTTFSFHEINCTKARWRNAPSTRIYKKLELFWLPGDRRHQKRNRHGRAWINRCFLHTKRVSLLLESLTKSNREKEMRIKHFMSNSFFSILQDIRLVGKKEFGMKKPAMDGLFHLQFSQKGMFGTLSNDDH